MALLGSTRYFSWSGLKADESGKPWQAFLTWPIWPRGFVKSTETVTLHFFLRSVQPQLEGGTCAVQAVPQRSHLLEAVSEAGVPRAVTENKCETEWKEAHMEPLLMPGTSLSVAPVGCLPSFVGRVFIGLSLIQAFQS